MANNSARGSNYHLSRRQPHRKRKPEIEEQLLK